MGSTYLTYRKTLKRQRIRQGVIVHSPRQGIIGLKFCDISQKTLNHIVTCY